MSIHHHEAKLISTLESLFTTMVQIRMELRSIADALGNMNEKLHWGLDVELVPPKKVQKAPKKGIRKRAAK